ncbi:sulfate transporter CysZ [Alteromonas sp. CI.11.F.A3]|uniref:sulfate transporter CysZ n=1 Tax=unclassified Alteromonas TaxID=2614992 RepID=UPI001B3A418B|nr:MULTISPECIES: sulfate transporter CysZ [unclassified Alteromonas]MBQ4830092.1 sulfate transporter CysZ [Alteromonas sp. MMG017]WOI35593.1 sulfate transporter CysZ [Alteromonas sp. CI.11.F.A3]
MSSRSGVHYFFEGFSLIKTKGLKRFVFVPLAINILLFSAAFYFLFGQIEYGISYVINLVPEWLGWVKTAVNFFLWPLAVLSVLLIFALIFGTLANWIAAPFNGVLSEKVERHLTGQAMGDDGLLDLVKDIPRTLGREFTKLFWYIPRAIGFLILFIFVPVFGQILWFLFSAWMMAIQYCDYPYDNHKIDFKRMQNHLSQHKGKSMSFGVMVNIFSLIPVVNFIVMPVAICGATSMWVSELRDEALRKRV